MEGNWLIGPDYKHKQRAVQSTSGAGPTSCPADAIGWAAIADSDGMQNKGSAWQMDNVTVANQWCGLEGPQVWIGAWVVRGSRGE
jgi:hypothetical protein